MKKFLLILFCAALTFAALASQRTLICFSKQVVTSGTPLRLSATNNFFHSIYIQNRATNSGNIYVMGTSNTVQRIVLTPGQAFPITAGPITQDLINLFDIWVDAANSGEIADCFVIQ